MTRIYYYRTNNKEPIKEFLDSIEKQTKEKVFRIFEHIEEYGIRAPIPNLKKLTGTELWEIRILGKQSIRIIYLLIKNDDILVLHGFVKKTQKTPMKELNIAIKRHQEWKKS